MFWRFNFFRIATDHFKTFYDFELNNPSPPVNKFEVRVVIGLPLLLASAFMVRGTFFPDLLQSSLLNALALLAGLLLNLLALGQSMIGGFERYPRAKIALQSLRDTVANISFGILMSLFSIMANISIGVFKNGLWFYAFHWFLYVTLFNLGLTLLVILSNMHALTMKQLNDRVGEKSEKN